MGIRKDTGIKQAWTVTVEEVFCIIEKRGESFEGMFCISLEAFDIDQV